ncbi:hypothetical protein [Nocardia sp. NBC_00511]|uniref:hypothetical protein n=1 Tax=Nocardia sp. NBC_00511 TaxID=2903591 RepID=UPI0030E56D9A
MPDLYRGLDPELARGLDPHVAEMLAVWADLHGRHYALDRWLVNGRSRQPVAVVRETDSHKVECTMLVLKVLSAERDSLRTNEFARHRRAERDAADFAAAHLSTFVHDAVPVSPRQWITFQRIAANAFENTEVLTVLLRRMLGLADEIEPPHARELTCRPEVFTDACRSIVAGVLGDWAGKPYILPDQKWSPAQFFASHLFDQLEPDGRLATWSRNHPAALLTLDGEPAPLPNPFAVARGELFADTLIAPLTGHSHGDLHTDNALIRVRPHTDVTDYYLIDTALYDSVGPLTRDPAHLLLYIIARAMEAVSPPQQSPLIEVLLDPITGPTHLLPGWLATLIQGIHTETTSWIDKSGLAPAWRTQSHLSLAACALLFLGRTSTRPQDKPWFLRLAARATAKFAQEHSLPWTTLPTQPLTPTPSPLAPQPDSQLTPNIVPSNHPNTANTANAAESANHVPNADPQIAATPPTASEPEPSGRRKKSRYTVNVRDGKGIQIGDNGHQHNDFR